MIENLFCFLDISFLNVWRCGGRCGTGSCGLMASYLTMYAHHAVDGHTPIFRRTKIGRTNPSPITRHIHRLPQSWGIGCPRKARKKIKLKYIDLIVVISARKSKSRAQLTPMRTTVAYGGTKHCFMLSRGILRMLCSIGIHLLRRIPRVKHT